MDHVQTIALYMYVHTLGYFVLMCVKRLSSLGGSKCIGNIEKHFGTSKHVLCREVFNCVLYLESLLSEWANYSPWTQCLLCSILTLIFARLFSRMSLHSQKFICKYLVGYIVYLSILNS